MLRLTLPLEDSVKNGPNAIRGRMVLHESCL
jgi:hypothetical protein